MALARWTWPIWRFSVEGGGRREGRARRRAASRPSWASAASRTDGQTSSRPGGLRGGVVRGMRVERRSFKFAGRRGARSSGVGSAGGTGSIRGESEGRGQRHLPELQPLRGERNGEEEVRNIGFREVWREEEVGHGVGGTGAPVGRGTRDSDSERRCGETTNLGKSNEELTTSLCPGDDGASQGLAGLALCTVVPASTAHFQLHQERLSPSTTSTRTECIWISPRRRRSRFAGSRSGRVGRRRSWSWREMERRQQEQLELPGGSLRFEGVKREVLINFETPAHPHERPPPCEPRPQLATKRRRRPRTLLPPPPPHPFLHPLPHPRLPVSPPPQRNLGTTPRRPAPQCRRSRPLGRATRERRDAGAVPPRLQPGREDPRGSRDGDRGRRDGPGTPESRGDEPQGAKSEFLVSSDRDCG